MLFVQAEQRLGYTYVIVEVALCSQNVVFLREYCLDEFLGCGLTIGACNTDDGDVELATMFAGNILEGLQTVANLD